MSSAITLLEEIEAFCARHDMGTGRFGIQSVNDHRFVYRLRAGKDTRMATADRVREYMRTYERERLQQTSRPRVRMTA